ncbi:hypothetical protein BKA82DRAFT_770660 [Pisolithus tinctorius]|uniref:Uncharacterized protein n=1 Tax=Pisolithus tinctorius Marx 270 TaxID=870435 RepID=A0A0C3NYA7_PISTI|nr:hypothetical protein BKA82DRAFT_770660 [Pisolithus tinctorius]KIO00139.1 hypothetical protein M404DRAFT_770660 [Pisolithus tinctorius Marx 270]
MDELTEARAAALAAMENREQELLSELISPIDRLPDESLLRVLEFYLEEAAQTCDVYIRAKRELASVSRRWRDLILHSPSLWTLLKVTSSWSEARAKIYMTRSSQSLLDIVIRFRGYGSYADEETLLNVLASGAHRWRSLTIHNDTDEYYGAMVLEWLNHLSFPSLKRVSITNYFAPLRMQGEPYQPIFLRPQISPHLEQVHLHVYVSNAALIIPHPSLLEGLSCLGLTSLCISGYADDINLRPNCMQLPLLEEFVCTLTYAKSLIHALDAPRLRHFDCSPSSWNDSPSTIFADLHSKFNSVDHLHLSGSTAYVLSEAVCLAFPNVCDLQLTQCLGVLLDSCPADFLGDALHWKNLKHLTIDSTVGTDLGSLDGLVAWLLQRLNAGQSKLHVTVTARGCGTPSLFQKLTELCYLEWLDIYYNAAVMRRQSQSGSQAWVVRIHSIESAFRNAHIM